MQSTTAKDAATKKAFPDRSPSGDSVFSFCTSFVTITVLLIRIGSLIPPEWWPTADDDNYKVESSILGWILHNRDMAPIWTSILVRPFETWDHVREARAIRHIFGTQFRDAYRGSYVHCLPPLVLAALEPVLDWVQDEEMQDIVIGIGTHLVDLLIAIQLLQLGKLVLAELQDPWEEVLQPKVPKSLRPPLEHIFALNNQQIAYTNELPPTKVVSVEESKGELNNNDSQNKDSNTNGEKKVDNQHSPANGTDNDADDEISAPNFVPSDLPLLAAQVYFYSPLTALASGMGSTHHSFQNLWLLLLLFSLHEGCRKQSSIPLAAFWLALASSVELHYWAFLIPLSVWLMRRSAQSQECSEAGTRRVASLLFFYALWTLCLQGLSLLLVGSSHYWAMVQSSFGHVFLWKHLHPNLSVLWYLNMELFESYRVYFAVLIGGLPYLLVIPVTIRLHRYPMVLMTVFWMLWTMIRPTTTLVDVNVACCLALLCPRSLARMRTPTTLIPAFSLLVPISLYIVTLWMWLETGQGEANFNFFQCLAYCAFLSTLCLEFCGASMRRDKVLRLTEKLCRQETETAIENDESKQEGDDSTEQ